MDRNQIFCAMHLFCSIILIVRVFAVEFKFKFEKIIEKLL